MVSLSHHKPTKYTDFIDLILFAHAKTTDFSLMLIPSHYIMLYVPLNTQGYFYNDKHYKKPMLHKMVLTPEYISLPAGSKLIAVRFFPFGAYPFQTFETNQIKEQLIEISFDKKIEENINIQKEIAAVFKSLNKLYSPKRVEKTQLLKTFYYYLLNTDKNTSVKAFCELKKINYMTMYREFKQTIGVSPKKIERLIKFRKSVDYMVHSKNKLTEIGLKSGYYDQSHFIKEFNYFIRMSPSNYIDHLKKNNLYNFSEFIKLSSIK